MIRRLAYCLSVLLVLVSACTKEPEAHDGLRIELSVRCGEPELTKAETDDTRDGENKYNENLISTVDFFFYPGETPDRNAPAVFHVTRTSGQRGSDVFLLDLTDSDVSRIFPTSPVEIRKATVFTVVNYPGRLVEDEGDLSGTSLNTLESLQVTTDFVLSAPNYKQTTFMMSGTRVISLRSRTSNIVATDVIDLVRYASKMTVSIKVAPSVTLGDAVWEPMLEDMAIYLVNGAKTVTLGGEDATPTYFSYSGNPRKFAYIDAQDGDKLKPLVSKSGEYYNSHPMYMYPQYWTYGETEETTYRVEPYLKLELPWHRTTQGGYSSTQKQCYYKIFIPDDSRGGDYIRHFTRNSWYHLDIDVGLLGADTDEAAVELSGSIFMVPWQNVDREIDRMAEIGNARYLSVDRTSYTLHNITSTDIRYTTSHTVVLQDIKATCPYYGESTSGTARGGVITCNTGNNYIDLYPEGSYYLDYDLAHRKEMNGGEDWLTDIGTAIHFSHPINNVYTDPKFDYSPFTVSFTIAHEGTDDDRYRKRITLVQTPAIYISSRPNTGTFTDTGLKNGSDRVYYSENWGYVYVDGRQIVRAEARKDAQDKWYEYPAHNGTINDAYMAYFRGQYPDDAAVQAFNAEDFHWRVVWYTGGGRDIFRINVTVLPDDSDLVIGDPRTDEVDNLNQTFREGTPSMAGTAACSTTIRPRNRPVRPTCWRPVSASPPNAAARNSATSPSSRRNGAAPPTRRTASPAGAGVCRPRARSSSWPSFPPTAHSPRCSPQTANTGLPTEPFSSAAAP